MMFALTGKGRAEFLIFHRPDNSSTYLYWVTDVNQPNSRFFLLSPLVTPDAGQGELPNNVPGEGCLEAGEVNARGSPEPGKGEVTIGQTTTAASSQLNIPSSVIMIRVESN
jgi:hypothetical protein